MALPPQIAVLHAEAETDNGSLQQVAREFLRAGAERMAKCKSKRQTKDQRQRWRRESAGGDKQAEDKNILLDHADSGNTDAGGGPTSKDKLRGRAFRVRIYRLLLAVIDIKDGHQLRDLQQVPHPLGEIGQLD